MRYSVSSSLVFATNLCRVLVGVVFVASGFVKAIDPLGTQYKIQDYLEALGLLRYAPDYMTLATSVLLSGMEFVLGVAILLAARKRVTTVLAAVFMIVMTIITIWLYVANPVSDCGCFGDAIHLTNGETLAKNIVLLLMVSLLVWRKDDMKPLLSKSSRWVVYNCSIVFTIGISTYCLYYLPLFDFRPYKVGTNIWESMQIPEGAEQPEFKTTFIMKKDGVTREFILDNYPDSTWEFVDSKTELIKKGYEPPIHDLSFQTLDGEDVTEQILTAKGYTYLLISPHLENASDSNFGEIELLYEEAINKGYGFYCITASGEKAISKWQDSTGAEYQFLNCDATTLKTIIRSNPGLLLLKDGVIVKKWSHNGVKN